MIDVAVVIVYLDVDLGNMLKARGIDVKFFKGEYHNQGVFQEDSFRALARPLVAEILDDIDDDVKPKLALQFGVKDDSLLPAACVNRCIKYVRRRREYLTKKAKKKQSQPKAKRSIEPQIEEVDVASATPPDVASATSPDETPDVASATRPDETPDVASVSYDCIDCSTSMSSLEECWPPEDRVPETVFHRCKACYEKYQFKDKDAKNRSKKKTEKAKLKELQKIPRPKQIESRTKRKGGEPTTKSTKRAKTKSTTLSVKGYTYKYVRFTNVMVKWGRDGYFAALIMGYSKGKYKVYFPADGQELSDVPESDIRMPKKDTLWSKVRVSDAFGWVFTRSKGQEYKVIKVGKGKNISKYVCNHIETADSIVMDMGDVLRKYIREVYPIETRKFACVFTS